MRRLRAPSPRAVQRCEKEESHLLCPLGARFKVLVWYGNPDSVPVSTIMCTKHMHEAEAKVTNGVYGLVKIDWELL